MPKNQEKKLRKSPLQTAAELRKEFKKQVGTAIGAAFAFLIALSWKDPIQASVNTIIDKLGLGKGIGFQFLVAVLVTFIAVIALIILSKWSSKE
ncbi:MAG: DUF5654 family protein [archaeon]